MEPHPLDLDAIQGQIVDQLTRIRPHLRAAEIRAESSLTQDLGLDSLDLAELFSFIKSEIVEFDLTPWLLTAARKGTDSIGSLVEHVTRARAA